MKFDADEVNRACKDAVARGELLPTDVLAWRTAMSVAGEYDYIPSANVVQVWVFWLLLAVSAGAICLLLAALFAGQKLRQLSRSLSFGLCVLNLGIEVLSWLLLRSELAEEAAAFAARASVSAKLPGFACAAQPTALGWAALGAAFLAALLSLPVGWEKQ